MYKQAISDSFMQAVISGSFMTAVILGSFMPTSISYNFMQAAISGSIMQAIGSLVSVAILNVGCKKLWLDVTADRSGKDKLHIGCVI